MTRPLRGGVGGVERRAGGRVSGWAGGALAALEFAGVRGETVLCPSNTFMATPLADPAGGRPGRVRRLQPRRPLHVVRGLRGQGRAATGRGPRSSSTSAATSPSRSSGSPRYCRDDGHLPARGLRPRPWRRAGTAAGPGTFGRRRRLLVLRDEDGLDRRGRRARLRRRATCSSFARAFRNYGKPDHEVARPELPHERVHRRARRSSRPSGWRRSSPGRTPSPASTSTRSTRAGSSCPTAWSPASTSTSSSTRSSARPARSTTSPATASWAPATTCPTPTGSPRTTGACRSTTAAEDGARMRRPCSSPAAPASSAPTSSTGCPPPATEPRIFDLRPSPCHAGDVETVLGDLLDPDDVCARRCAAATRSCHLAAAADVGDVAADPAGAEELNARGTLNVLEAARDAGVARVVYASTIWVYSDVDADDGRRGHAARAARPPLHRDASSPASCTAAPTRELYGLEYTILRFGIPYGPRARPAAVIPSFVAQGAGRRAADDRRRAASRRGASSTSRTSPRASWRRSRPRRPAGPTTSSASEDVDDPRDRRDRPAEVVGAVEIVHTEGRAGDFARARRSQATAPSASSAGGRHLASPRACARYVAGSRPQPERRRAGAAAGARSPGGRPSWRGARGRSRASPLLRAAPWSARGARSPVVLPAAALAATTADGRRDRRDAARRRRDGAAVG